MNSYTIVEYHEDYRQQVLEVWENAVRATHEFLSAPDFIEIRELVHNIDFAQLQVFCLTLDQRVLGFIGVLNDKIEMLFLDPAYFGKGLGQELLAFAVTELNAEKVDVNEQNAKAVKFYEKFGFETFERTDRDDQGRDYPLLRMKFNKQGG